LEAESMARALLKRQGALPSEVSRSLGDEVTLTLTIALTLNPDWRFRGSKRSSRPSRETRPNPKPSTLSPQPSTLNSNPNPNPRFEAYSYDHYSGDLRAELQREQCKVRDLQSRIMARDARDGDTEVAEKKSR